MSKIPRTPDLLIYTKLPQTQKKCKISPNNIQNKSVKNMLNSPINKDCERLNLPDKWTTIIQNNNLNEFGSFL